MLCSSKSLNRLVSSKDECVRPMSLIDELEHCFEHLTQVMNKPISSLFVFSVMYCVVFKQKLK